MYSPIHIAITVVRSDGFTYPPCVRILRSFIRGSDVHSIITNTFEALRGHIVRVFRLASLAHVLTPPCRPVDDYDDILSRRLSRPHTYGHTCVHLAQ